MKDSVTVPFPRIVSHSFSNPVGWFDESFIVGSKIGLLLTLREYEIGKRIRDSDRTLL